MNLILWRHAEAQEGKDDLLRQLTPKGQMQAKQIAKWLGTRLPKSFQILSSQAERSKQTANALSDKYTVFEQLNPDSNNKVIWQFLWKIGWQDNLVVVGHQPWIGKLASQLLNGVNSGQNWSVKKGAIWWFEVTVLPDQLASKLVVSMVPKML